MKSLILSIKGLIRYWTYYLIEVFGQRRKVNVNVYDIRWGKVKCACFKVVKVDDILINCCGVLTPVKESVHYNLAGTLLKSPDSPQPVDSVKAYKSYFHKNKESFISESFDKQIDRLEGLAEKIKNNGYDYEISPVILVNRYKVKKYIVVDGAHRLSLLAAQGKNEIKAAIFLKFLK